MTLKTNLYCHPRESGDPGKKVFKTMDPRLEPVLNLIGDGNDGTWTITPWHHQGFSFLEITTVIFIIALLLTIGIPSFNQFLMRQERESTLARVALAIEYAKQEAFSRGKTVTLCGSYNRKTCYPKNWTGGFIIFENAEEDLHPTHNSILHSFEALKYGQLHFDEFGQNLNIKANGMTINVGTFTYCPKQGDTREARGLIINKVSRTYTNQKENAEGKPLFCR